MANKPYTPERYQRYKEAYDRARNKYIKTEQGAEIHRQNSRDSMRKIRARQKAF